MASDKSSNAGTLFHYGTQNLLSDLKRGYLLFESDWRFIQPFVEFQRWHAEKTQPITEADILQGMKLEYEKLPENIKALLVFEDFLAQREKFEPAIRKSLQKRRGATVKGYPLDRFDSVQYLRLFASAVNQRAWQVFGDDHRGVCVGLDAQSQAFKPVSGYPILLKPVQYGVEHQTKPSADNPVPGAFYDDESNLPMSEWRALLPNPTGGAGRLKLKKGVVNSLYLSVYAEETLKQQLVDLVTRDLNFRGVKLYQVLPDIHRWRLTATPL